MRLVSAVLFVALTGTWALADEAKPADPRPEVTKKKVPYRVVKTLPETGQVLLFDRSHASHVVAEIGQSLDGYFVEDIDEEEVTLVAENGAQVILTAPPPPPQQKTRVAKQAPAPVDPYADTGEQTASTDTAATATAAAPAGATGTAPADPYAEPEAPTTPGEGGVRVASAATPSTATAAPTAAPSTSGYTPSPSPSPSASAPAAAPIVDAGAPELEDPYGDPGIAAFAEAVGATPAPPAPEAKPAPAKGSAKGSKTPAKTAAPAPDAASALAAAATGSPAPAPKATGRAAPAAGTTAIARAEVDAALADFGKLAGSFRATFTPDGLRFDAVHDGTILTKIGLRKGDVVTYVDGQPLRSLDDAATLYARASTVKNTTIQVVRDGKLVTLRVAIH